MFHVRIGGAVLHVGGSRGTSSSVFHVGGVGGTSASMFHEGE